MNAVPAELLHDLRQFFLASMGLCLEERYEMLGVERIIRYRH